MITDEKLVLTDRIKPITGINVGNGNCPSVSLSVPAVSRQNTFKCPSDSGLWCGGVSLAMIHAKCPKSTWFSAASFPDIFSKIPASVATNAV